MSINHHVTVEFNRETPGPIINGEKWAHFDNTPIIINYTNKSRCFVSDDRGDWPGYYWKAWPASQVRSTACASCGSATSSGSPTAGGGDVCALWCNGAARGAFLSRVRPVSRACCSTASVSSLWRAHAGRRTILSQVWAVGAVVTACEVLSGGVCPRLLGAAGRVLVLGY